MELIIVMRYELFISKDVRWAAVISKGGDDGGKCFLMKKETEIEN